MVSNCLHDQQTEQSAAMTEELSCSDLVLRFFRSSAGVKAPYKSHLSDVRRRYRLPLKSQLHWQSTVGLLTCSWICCHVRMMFLPHFFSCYVFLMYVLCVLDFEFTINLRFSCSSVFGLFSPFPRSLLPASLLCCCIFVGLAFLSRYFCSKYLISVYTCGILVLSGFIPDSGQE